MNQEEDTSMTRGKVKWFDGKKGYGFIVPEEGGGDIFVHYSSIQTENEFKSLKEGMMVQFDVQEGKNGLQAHNVVVVS
jgi:cold shock protein